ncbi:MAG: hypothetical protein IJW99_06735 [Clostridia bacterium]|nr:hypothetical protein [Clostridia bacterium]
MNCKQMIKKTVAMLLSFCLLASSFVIPAVAEDATPVYTTGEVVRRIDPTEYIVLDLSQGNVTVNAATYTGWRASISDGAVVWTSETNGAWTEGDKFYIIQKPNKTITVEGSELVLTSVDINAEAIINQSDAAVATAFWATAADSEHANRSSTVNYIDIPLVNQSAVTKYHIYIDDIWSINQYYAQSGGKGGIRISSSAGTSAASKMQIDLHLVGDNRLAGLFYNDNTNDGNGLTFYDGGKTIPSIKNGVETDVVGSLTVIGNPDVQSGMGTGQYLVKCGGNHWNSVIGCDDSSDNVYDYVFEGGVIYAAANENENCTAIGAGGNGISTVTINGGTVTAVSHGTGTAIGGGIAHTATGGKGYVTINGGSVYAYNFGLKAYDYVKDGQFGGGYTRLDIPFVPGTAIGGAGSLQSTGSLGEVNITGGYVYAWSRGGAALGGGNTVAGNGGEATVNISGGEVHAVSEAYYGETAIKASANYATLTHYDISAGTAIGGGNTNNGTGGRATVTISGESTRVTAYGIGGGNSTKLTGGLGKVTIDGGTVAVKGNIGGGSSELSAGGKGEVTINNGTVSVEGGIGGGDSVNALGGPAEVKVVNGSITASGVIGGGNSTAANGGTATLTVSGGRITAHGIGGGNSVNADGGGATVTVTGGRVTSTADIGGGASTNGVGGTATVTVSGGTLTSNGIGGGYSETKGYSTGSVTVTGGSLNSSMAAIPMNDKGDTLFLTRISLFRKSGETEETLVEQAVTNNSATFRNMPIDRSYHIKDIYSDQVGMIYLWLPLGVSITGLTMEADGEHVYSTPDTETDGDVDAGDVGVLMYNSTLPRYVLNVAGSGYYMMYLDEAMTQPFSGSVVVPQSDFTFYLRVQEDVSLTPYVGIVTEGAKKLLPATAPTPILDGENPVTSVTDGVTYVHYQMTRFIDRDTEIRFVLAEDETQSYVLDLTGGNVSITENADGSLTITQNGYTMENFRGELYLTSAGYPTDNTVEIRSEAENSNIQLYADQLNIAADSTALNIESGAVTFGFGEHDNQIRADEGAAITIAGDASLQINMESKDSLKINNSGDASLISGAGSFVLSENGGFLQMSTPTEDKQIAVGSYEFIGTNEQLTTELYKGEGYGYTVIGFVKDDTLHDLNAAGSTGGSNFKARGFYPVYVGVEHEINLEDTVNEDGDFEITLYALQGVARAAAEDQHYIGNYYITGKNQARLTEGVDYTAKVLETAVVAGNTKPTRILLTIKGSCFKDQNLTIYASAGNYIAFNPIPYTGVYDAQPHTFSLEYDSTLFDVYYSEEEITIEGEALKRGGVTITTADLLTAKPTYTQVTGTVVGDCTAVVYFYLVEKGSGGNYAPAIGSTTVLITQGANKWDTSFYCPNVIKGTEPFPSVQAVWGTTVYTYEIMSGDTWVPVDVENYASWSEGKYRVLATVAASRSEENDACLNYAEIVSDYHQFEVIEMSVYRASGKRLDTLTTSDTTALSITRERGAFTVYFMAQSKGAESNVRFDTVTLPAGTKLTLIDVTAQEFYYYTVPASGSQKILLNQFIRMGSTSEKFSPASPGEAVEYQICVEYADLSQNTFYVVLNDEDDANAKPTISPSLTMTEEFTAAAGENAAQLNVSQKGDEVSAAVRVNMSGQEGYRLLAFRINRTDLVDGSYVNEEFANVSVSLSDGSNTLTPVHQTVDLAIFRLGGESVNATVNGSYTLTMSGMAAGRYDLTADVRIVEETAVKESDGTLSYAYVLQNETAKNHLVKTIDVAEYVEPSLTVRTAFVEQEAPSENDLRVIVPDGRSGALSEIELTVSSDSPTVTVEVLRFEYDKFAPIVDDSNNQAWQIPLTTANKPAMLTINELPAAIQEKGVYRLIFTTADGTVSYEYNLIVTEQ